MNIGLILSGDDVATDTQSVIGRQVANERIIGLLADISELNKGKFFIAIESEDVFKRSRLDVDAQIVSSATALFEPCDLIVVLSPNIHQFAKLRAEFRLTAKDCLLVGITHAINSERTAKAIASSGKGIVCADALICTSASVRDVIQKMLPPSASLRIIHTKLPVSRGFFENAPNNYQSVRQRPKQDLSIVYVGRLDYTSKLHYASLYSAASGLAAAMDVPTTLTLVGWFPSKLMASHFIRASSRLAENVVVHHVDGRSGKKKKDALSRADVALCLADNVQESFGLVPLEMVMERLPMITSSWNGYRDSLSKVRSNYFARTIFPHETIVCKIFEQLKAGDLTSAHAAAILALLTTIDHSEAVSRLAHFFMRDDDYRYECVSQGIEEIASFRPCSLKHEWNAAFQCLLNGEADQNLHILHGSEKSNVNYLSCFESFADHSLSNNHRICIGQNGALIDSVMIDESLKILPRYIYEPKLLSLVYEEVSNNTSMEIRALTSGSRNNIKILVAVSILLKFHVLLIHGHGKK